MKNERINILCASDAKYAAHLGVTLLSLFENNRKHEIHVFVFVDNKDNGIWNQYSKMAETYHQSVEIIEIPVKRLLDYGAFELWYFSLAIYYRLLAAELLPNDVHKVLYLDGDMIIDEDILSLWDSDLCDKALGVCPDYKCYEPSQFERVHYPIEKGYFNSGMLLFNLDYWREHNTSQHCLDYLKNHKDEIIYMDQDVLNAVLIDNVKWLHCTYNFQNALIKSSNFNHYSPRMQHQIREVFRHPAIIHYNGPSKPWHLPCFGFTYYNRWLHYQLRSPWPMSFGLGCRSLYKCLKCCVKSICWVLGIGRKLRGIAKELEPYV